ncbi:MAG: aminomethyltransferase family protein [Deltaproteobacteria bacterium]|nr:aminomethyltransferase family protein [Deltaproteobacteria bacterium]
MTRPTPFHSRTSALNQGQRWEDWEGFLAATMYSLDPLVEYNTIRLGCGLFDVSPLHKYEVRGPDAQALLQRMVVRNLAPTRPGRAFYTVWCDDDGKVVDDGAVFHVAENHFRLTSTLPNLEWLIDNSFGFDATIEDVSEEIVGIALQGPTSRDLLQKLTGVDLSALKFWHCTDADVSGRSSLISRSGYTGDLGFEIFVRPDDAETIWDSAMALAPDYQMRPCGLVALDMARIEAGLPQIDAEFISAKQTLFEVQTISPFELGLAWMCKLDGDFFVGRDALIKEKTNGTSRWNTVGVELDVTYIEKYFREFAMPLHLPEQSWNEAVPIYADEAQENLIGRGTSGMWSPLLKKYIVIARIPPQHAKLGSRFFVEEMIEAKAFSIPATVVKMPFFDPPRKKA